jgi:dynein heavy chain
LKAWRPEKLLFAFSDFVKTEQGKFFIENPSVSMELVYSDTDVKTPLIFVLSSGADPTTALLKFAKEMKQEDKFYPISLGQG